MYKSYYNSPIGLLEIEANDLGITKLGFVDEKKEHSDNTITKECIKQLEEYFLGKRKQFELPLMIEGTPFQKKVYDELIKVPFGESVSYKDLAIRIDNEKACRAVGGANNKNKIAIIIPCHRVIGKNGKLVGYAYGTEKKAWLLSHEKEHAV